VSWISSANNVIGYRLDELKFMVGIQYNTIQYNTIQYNTHVSLAHHVQNGSAADSGSLSKRLPRDYSTIKFDPSHKSSAEVKDRENSSALLLVFGGGDRESICKYFPCDMIYLLTAIG